MAYLSPKEYTGDYIAASPVTTRKASAEELSSLAQALVKRRQSPDETTLRYMKQALYR
jgi:hypothetical protein